MGSLNQDGSKISQSRKTVRNIGGAETLSADRVESEVIQEQAPESASDELGTNANLTTSQYSAVMVSKAIKITTPISDSLIERVSEIVTETPAGVNPPWVSRGPKVLGVNLTPYSVASTGNVYEYMLPAGTLTKTGDCVEFNVWGTSATGVISLTTAITVGSLGQSISTRSVSTASLTFQQTVRVYRTGASAADVRYDVRLGSNSTSTGFGSITDNLMADMPINAGLTAWASGAMNYKGYDVRFFPAP